MLRTYLTKFRAFLSCSGASSGGGVIDLERLRGRFEFIEADSDLPVNTGSSSESSIYSAWVGPVSNRDLPLRERVNR